MPPNNIVAPVDASRTVIIIITPAISDRTSTMIDIVFTVDDFMILLLYCNMLWLKLIDYLVV